MRAQDVDASSFFKAAKPARPNLFARRIEVVSLSLAAWAIALSSVAAIAQTNPGTSQPYAAINRHAISYAGPGRDAAYDLPGTEIKLGILAPLQGSRKAESEALIQAAQMAVEDEAANPFPHGRRLALIVRDESGRWGRAASEIVRLVFDDRVAALITLLDGSAAHLAEQVGNRVGVPVLTLSSDSTTTRINIPWLFRLVPNDTVQAHAFAENIYRQRGFRKVVLVTERDHDGRVGGEEFEKAARGLGAPMPARLVVDSARPDPESTVRQLETPEALVLWTGPEMAAQLLPRLKEALPSRPIYLCWKAAQATWGESATGQGQPCLNKGAPAEEVTESRVSLPAPGVAQPFTPAASAPQASSALAIEENGGLWVVVSPPARTAARADFERRYQARTGTAPSPAAAKVYDAVRLLATALRQSGPNRARLRDALAGLSDFARVSGTISFDGAGNNQAEVALLPWR